MSLKFIRFKIELCYPDIGEKQNVMFATEIDLDRIFNELNEIGKSDSDNLSIKDLTKFDQFHYHGTDAIDIAIDLLEINSNSKILDVGSGIGGPARYIARREPAS